MEWRGYLGASVIGKDCGPYKVFELKGYPRLPVGPRQRMIFDIGHAVEEIMINNLTHQDFVITDRQKEYRTFGGHIIGHVDGVIALPHEWDEPRLLEIKSANDQRFGEMKEYGIKLAEPEYYAQVQFLMMLSGLSQCEFYVVNKNDGEVHSETINVDLLYAEGVLGIAIQNVIDPPPRIAKTDRDYRCVQCPYAEQCWHGLDVALRTCKRCTHSIPRSDGSWWCLKHDKVAEVKCSDWKPYEPEARAE